MSYTKKPREMKREVEDELCQLSLSWGYLGQLQPVFLKNYKFHFAKKLKHKPNLTKLGDGHDQKKILSL
jgi:hypothetical protein